MSTTTCATCGGLNAAGGIYCALCGSPFAASPPAPSPATPVPVHNKPETFKVNQPVVAALIGVAIVLMIALAGPALAAVLRTGGNTGGLGGAPSGSDRTIYILEHTVEVNPAKNECFNRNLGSGMDVTATNEVGEIVGTARVPTGVRGPRFESGLPRCDFSITLNVKDADFYTITVGDLKPVRLSRRDLEAKNWNLEYFVSW